MGYTAQQLSDREEIRDLAMRYCHGVDRLDVDCMKSAYWPEAIDEHGNFVGNAHEFSDYCMTAHLKWSWTMHSIYNHQVGLHDDGVTATGEIYNITNGERFATYYIEGEVGSSEITINGAAAHKAKKGDIVIICCYAEYEEEEAVGHRPRLVYVDEHNHILKKPTALV